MVFELFDVVVGSDGVEGRRTEGSSVSVAFCSSVAESRLTPPKYTTERHSWLYTMSTYNPSELVQCPNQHSEEKLTASIGRTCLTHRNQQPSAQTCRKTHRIFLLRHGAHELLLPLLRIFFSAPSAEGLLDVCGRSASCAAPAATIASSFENPSDPVRLLESGGRSLSRGPANPAEGGWLPVEDELECDGWRRLLEPSRS